ncbi:MAG: lytic murein transglycosylase [Syntrophaceae bacterium]|nr:lytic murein transglycosylase [Syntrophaceae bacterium]HOD63002.1 lytic murein transglycosylase [Smithellaceae bacterium]HOE22939.1 lytic murein transglycosylase [Smithellaceae bacterium]HOR62178.1 lytic murein transglycosylase [Smithellaceae bacterium]HQK90201.1 lytic murein transglycosylase [Smithellaceae bacterium]
MKRRFPCLAFIIFFLVCPPLPAMAGEDPRSFVEGLLVAEGLEPTRASSLLQDTRISICPDIVLKNLFFSEPKGSVQKPDVMDIDPRQIERGRDFMKENAAVLSAVEQRFGASPRIITAILIIESRLGTYPMPYNVVNAYANLAFVLDPAYWKEIQNRYADAYPQIRDDATSARAKRKAKWAVRELYHLSRIADHLEIDPLSISGSFAGAMGPAQFIPSSFWIFGMDGDGDGLADPSNMTDAKFSMGHYLRKFGWKEETSVEQKRRAIWHYNRSRVYVNTVMMLYEQLGH